MSKTQKIEVQGLVFETPPIPKKSQIYLSDLPKKEQYWRRRELPNSLDGMTQQEVDDFISQEWDYIVNGFWYMNNGVANFITGINYFFLQHYLLQHGEYGEYRETDRDFYYFWSMLEANKKAIGIIALKFRRRGLSSIATCISLYIALTENNKHCGLISKDGETVRDGLFKEMVMNAYVKLPEWLKPRNSGTDRSSKELIFLKQAERIGKNNKGDKTENIGLNNKITYRNTSLNAYDGQNLRYLVIDECGKWKSEVPIERYYPIAKKCALKGAKRVGMLFLLSTANELESGGSGFRELWKRSDHTLKGCDGITQTGLYRFFMPAWMGFHGYFNRYGQPIIENPTPDEIEWLKSQGEVLYPEIGSKQYLQMERDKLKDSPDDLSDEYRMNPWTPEEAFFEKSTNCIINPLVANQQIENNDRNPVPRRKVKFYRDYATNKVKIMDTQDGPWEFIYLPEEHEANNNKMVYNKKTPMNKEFFGIGVDPYASSEGAAYSQESKGIAYLKRFFNPLDPDNSDLTVGRLNYRPKLKSLFFEQVFMASEYFGCLCNWEATIPDFWDFAMENGYENFLVYTPVELRTSQSKLVKAGTPATSKKSAEFHVNMIIKDFNENHHKYYFNELLYDLIKFTPEDRTKFDDTMAFGYTCITQHVCTVRSIAPEKKERKAIVKRYSIY